MSRDKFPRWSLQEDGYLDEPVPEPEPRRAGCSVFALILLAVLVAGLSDPLPVRSEEPEGGVGTAIYSASASWCAPTPDHCQGWGGNARLAAVNSFRFGDEPYPVRVWRGDTYVDATVVSHCACFGELGYIDLSVAAWRVLEPNLLIGRIDVEVEVLTDPPEHPDDRRMRIEDGGPDHGPNPTLPPTDAVQ